MKHLRRYIKQILKESYYDSSDRASDPGDHDKILGMIQTMDVKMWNQAFSFLEMGMALDWDEDAKVDLIWDIYDGINTFQRNSIYPIQRLINRYDNPDPFMPKPADILTRKEVEGPGGMRDQVKILSKNWEDMKLAVANLLGLSGDWWKSFPNGGDGFEEAFREAGII